MSNFIKGGLNTPVERPYPVVEQFGQGSAPLKIYRILLDSSRTNKVMAIGGSFVWAYRASSLTASMEVQFNNEENDPITFFQGTSLAGFKFSHLIITNSSQASEWIDLLVVRESGIMRALNPANTFSEVSLTKATGFATIADKTIVAGAAAASILAADTTRRSVNVTSLSSNSQLVRIGDSNTNATHGVPLYPGETLNIDTTAAIYAYTAAGANQTLAVTYTTD